MLSSSLSFVRWLTQRKRATRIATAIPTPNAPRKSISTMAWDRERERERERVRAIVYVCFQTSFARMYAVASALVMFSFPSISIASVRRANAMRLFSGTGGRKRIDWGVRLGAR
jgi:hypothetical protein